MENIMKMWTNLGVTIFQVQISRNVVYMYMRYDMPLDRYSTNNKTEIQLLVWDRSPCGQIDRVRVRSGAAGAARAAPLFRDK